jgi:hypothetical protein
MKEMNRRLDVRSFIGPLLTLFLAVGGCAANPAEDGIAETEDDLARGALRYDPDRAISNDEYPSGKTFLVEKGTEVRVILRGNAWKVASESSERLDYAAPRYNGRGAGPVTTGNTVIFVTVGSDLPARSVHQVDFRRIDTRTFDVESFDFRLKVVKPPAP